MTDFKAYLSTRRSTPFPLFGLEAPSSEELTAILERAARVPDHGKLTPWRFIIISREKGVGIGKKLIEFLKNDGENDDKRLEIESNRFNRSPLCIALVSTATEHVKIPQWEQLLSGGAVGMNLLHAAQAHGFGANWVTEWVAYDPRVKALFKLAAHEQFIGFVHIGKANAKAEDRVRPNMAAITSHFEE